MVGQHVTALLLSGEFRRSQTLGTSLQREIVLDARNNRVILTVTLIPKSIWLTLICMRSMLTLLTLAAALTPAPARAWGQTGHRVVGAIAQIYLGKHAQTAVKSILGSEDLAEASNWPDFMRSSPEPYWQKTSLPWHYVTVPAGKCYQDVGAPAEGDAYTALQSFSATLRDPKAKQADKAAALRFVVHIVGDLHQPLHVGRPGDRGGNEVAVTYFGQKTNLHSVWDSKLVDDEQLSYTEMAAWLRRRITPSQLAGWASPDPLVWIADSAVVRERAYPTEPALSYSYVFANRPVLDEQLEKAGVRLAAYLDALFENRHAVTRRLPSGQHPCLR
jgi:hypothetical protein